jgi:hypothetical protein
MNKIGLLVEGRHLRFRHTWDIIEAAEKGLLPDKVMLNTHPQRWERLLILAEIAA